MRKKPLRLSMQFFAQEPEEQAGLIVETAQQENAAEQASGEACPAAPEQPPDELAACVAEQLQKHPVMQRLEKALAEAGLQALSAAFPEAGIRSEADLQGMENYAAFAAYLQRGLSYPDAYLLANRERVFAQRQQAARQKALVEREGKAHLRATGSGTAVEEVCVPADTMQFYKQLFPSWSESRIRRHYQQAQG